MVYRLYPCNLEFKSWQLINILRKITVLIIGTVPSKVPPPPYLIYATLNKVQAFTPVTRHFMYKVQFFALSSDSVTTWLPQGHGIVS